MKANAAILFFIICYMCEEVLLDLVLIQRIIHCDHQPLGLGVHITNIHASFVVKKYVVALTSGIDAHIKLLLLGEGKHQKCTFS